ncbi:hypothetical protein JCM21142_72750 [Saccharicrinis fermentans DSM 9555 = JCM 21142]|uniref:Uncharacterized protein n=1 Tax=Saccharicrinis fermentans DSM 9555 = JCM 21142 TaxID=869213 RepID=W7XZE3_9BACT|nr:hypothetical protein JCM21142_72750 [Saccharicrinis fermentans DSM 9555 = JCM 21142]
MSLTHVQYRIYYSQQEKYLIFFILSFDEFCTIFFDEWFFCNFYFYKNIQKNKTMNKRLELILIKKNYNKKQTKNP